MILPVMGPCLILKGSQLTMVFSLRNWSLLYVGLVPDVGNRMWGLQRMDFVLMDMDATVCDVGCSADRMC